MSTGTWPAAVVDEAPAPAAEAQLTPRQLMWLRFRRHRLAVAGAVVVLGIYLVALLAEFLSPMDPNWGRARHTLHPPQPLQLIGPDGRFGLHVHAMKLQRDPETLEPRYVRDGDRIIRVGLFVPTEEPWHLFGLIPVQRKLIGPLDPTQPLYLAGAFLILLCCLTVIGTLISDVLLALIDPRIRLS